MNSQLAIIVAIDVERAVLNKSLDGCTYLVDNARFMGSTGEGTGELVTKVVGTQIMNWLVTGIDFSGTWPMPVLRSIGGEAVRKNIMIPELFDSPVLDGSGGFWWGATVDAREEGTHHYALGIMIKDEQKHIDLDLVYRASIHVTPPFAMDEDVQVPFSREPLRRVRPQPFGGRRMRGLDPDDPRVAKLLAESGRFQPLLRREAAERIKERLAKRSGS